MKRKKKSKKIIMRRILLFTVIGIVCFGMGYLTMHLYVGSYGKKKSVQTVASNKVKASEKKAKQEEMQKEAENEEKKEQESKAQDSKNTDNKNDKTAVQTQNKTVAAAPANHTDSRFVLPQSQGKVVYLTFDDGPSPQVTPQVLDILKENNIKATFFTLGQMDEYNPKMLLRERNEGHSIGNHSYSHVYSKVFGSAESFRDEIDRTTKIIKSILGSDFKVSLIRMPGGSGGKSQVFKDEVGELGYKYIDWTALSRDCEGKALTADEEYENVVATSRGQRQVVVLMHDAGAQRNTPVALKKVIAYFKAQGFEFKALPQ